MEKTPAAQDGRGEQVFSRLRQYLVAAAVSMLSFAQGSVIGWPSLVLPLLQSPDSPLDGGPLTDEEASWVSSATCVGAVLAVPLYAHLATRHSRKAAGYISATLLLPSWLALAFASSSRTALFVARFLAGLSCAGGTVVVPLYLAEVAHDSVRGALSTASVLFFNSGILFVYCAGSSISYRPLSCLCLALVPVFLVSFSLVPESPVYLVSRGRTALAVESVMRLQGVSQDHAGKVVGSLRKRAENARLPMDFRHLLSSRVTLRGLAIGVGLCLNHQLSGLFAVLSYTVFIFQEAGSSVSPHAATILVGALQILGACLSTVLVDRAGRKSLLLCSNCCMATCLACLGTYFYLSKGAASSGYDWVPLASLLVFIVAVSVGPGALCFLIISEVFSEQARGAATTICLCTLWCASFLVGKLFPGVSVLIGTHGCFWAFSACCLAGAAFAILCVPETKNRSLESILKELGAERVDLLASSQPLKEKELTESA